jgi:hypothetical protein
LCNPKHPSEDLLVKAEIEVVAVPTDLKNALSSIKEPLKRSNIYADKGFWYDALTELLNNPANNIGSFKLLEELRKSEIEAANKISDTQLQKNVQQQVLRLQEIVNTAK